MPQTFNSPTLYQPPYSPLLHCMYSPYIACNVLHKGLQGVPERGVAGSFY